MEGRERERESGCKYCTLFTWFREGQSSPLVGLIWSRPIKPSCWVSRENCHMCIYVIFIFFLLIRFWFFYVMFMWLRLWPFVARRAPCHKPLGVSRKTYCTSSKDNSMDWWWARWIVEANDGEEVRNGPPRRKFFLLLLLMKGSCCRIYKTVSSYFWATCRSTLTVALSNACVIGLRIALWPNHHKWPENL